MPDSRRLLSSALSLASFNSLFEMRPARTPSPARRCRLSILYLRCQPRRGRRQHGLGGAPFNSLFEMLDILPVANLNELAQSFNSLFEMYDVCKACETSCEDVVLSILYLRCDIRRVARPRLRRDTFNSLFEMLGLSRIVQRGVADPLSILYLRCRSLSCLGDPTSRASLSILYLRCSSPSAGAMCTG